MERPPLIHFENDFIFSSPILSNPAAEVQKAVWVLRVVFLRGFRASKLFFPFLSSLKELQSNLSLDQAEALRIHVTERMMEVEAAKNRSALSGAD